jgi:DNA primase large subunit
MHTVTARITKTELANMIERAVEEKILELLGDPDEKLTLKRSLRTRLLRQKRAVAKGQRGESFNRLVDKLGLL